VGAER